MDKYVQINWIIYEKSCQIYTTFKPNLIHNLFLILIKCNHRFERVVIDIKDFICEINEEYKSRYLYWLIFFENGMRSILYKKQMTTKEIKKIN